MAGEAGADGKEVVVAEVPRNHLVFYVNGSKREAFGIQPEITLLEYLRSSGLTG